MTGPSDSGSCSSSRRSPVDTRQAFGLNGEPPQGYTSTHDLAPVPSGRGFSLWTVVRLSLTCKGSAD